MDTVGIGAECAPLVTRSTRPEFGDYQANAALPAAKQLRRNPRELANEIVAALDLGDKVERIEIAGPGFINIHLSPAWLAGQTGDLLGAPAGELVKSDSPQTIVVDYSGPNLAKEMHVGHLRSTIIGDAVVRALEVMGHRVIRQNHMGDWGTQFGMLIAELEEEMAEGDESQLALADLEAFYQQAKRHFDADAEFATRAREYVVKLQSGDVHCRKLWQQFIDVSVAHSEELYRRLNVTLGHDDIRPESAYNDDLANIVGELQEQGLAQTDQGAQVVFLPELANKEGEPSPVIVQKSDGGYLYATSDLAALRYRSSHLQADRVLYFVDARQALHLQQVFTVAKKAGFVRAEVSLEHLAFGTMMGEDGKPFKTRAGGTVKLAELLEEAVNRASQLVLEKDPDLPAEVRDEVARKVGIGAIKYADLSKNRTSDYVFNWNTMLSFEGNTAPYLQYAYTRIQSIFRKAGVTPGQVKPAVTLEASHERALAMRLLQFPEMLEQVANDCTPHMLCSYLYDLASDFMGFYEHCPILKDDVTAAQRDSRLGLCSGTATVLSGGLALLGIEVMDQM